MLTRRAAGLLSILLLSGSGCATVEEPLWYKPGRDYTTVEFHRDREACTQGKKLDHDCMKAKGWMPVSPDRPAPATPTPSPTPRGRY